jgi:hypothetical protein
MATLPSGGPTGKVFWNKKEYIMFSKGNITYQFIKRNWKTGKITVLDLDGR